MNQLNSDQN